MKTALIALYLLTVTAPVWIALLAVPQTDHSFWSEVAKNSGLIGIGVLLMQFVLASRLPVTNRYVGLDSVMIFHRSMGMFALALLLVHPFLLAFGEGNWKLLYGLDQTWYIWAGKTTLLLLLVHILISVFRRSLRLSFERWRVFHDSLAIAIIALALLHSWYAGGDLSALPMQILWVLLGGAAIAAFVWHRLIRPRRLASKPYRVDDVRQESPDVCTLRFALPEGETANHLPGQFHFLTFPNSAVVPAEEHHFTISSSPTLTGFVESTIKASGDFTSQVGKIQSGETAIVQGNFGRFSYTLNRDESELVFIAGGIGITPLMSMLRHMRDVGDERPVTLIYGNKTEADIVFRSELDEMQSTQQPSLQVEHVLSAPDKPWAGENGHIDGKLLNRLLGGELMRTGFYLCGPAAMTSKVVTALRHHKVPRHNIHTESFSLTEDTAPTSARSIFRKWVTALAIVIAVVFTVTVAGIRAGGSEASGDGHEHSHSHHSH
ncbi:ferredoxin reductase family protein [Stieleria sp. ICT_E10.1]|uniref:ferredoxin reductase family protein n=1 Tax=Stieleria sedimenti TaxID=2976331 RepID=UPI00217F3A3F|nr:ferredoxin reductase family protein [Stieleria sedimenti]MCS7466380.1 ferredoxin reductase family protein [Stieleria sedimenti]